MQVGGQIFGPPCNVALSACLCSRTLQIDFRSESASGLIFVVGDFQTADMASAYLRDGYLTFARRCGSGRVFEVHHRRYDDMKWHTVSYPASSFDILRE